MIDPDCRKPVPLSNAVCMHCGYDIAGTIPNPDGQITCPECGVLLKPTTRRAMTVRDVHMHLVMIVVLPFILWASVTTLLPLAFTVDAYIFGMLVMMLFTLGYPVCLMTVAVIEGLHLYRAFRAHPRPYPRWAIPVWILAYAIPVASFYPLVFIVLESVM